MLLISLSQWEINLVLPKLFYAHTQYVSSTRQAPLLFKKTPTDKQLNTKDHFISQITPLSFLKRYISNCHYLKYILYFPMKLNTLKKNPQRNKYKAQQFHFMICFVHSLILHPLW